MLDKSIRSLETPEEVTAARSEQARRWNIVTELGPEAFAAALREARVVRA